MEELAWKCAMSNDEKIFFRQLLSLNKKTNELLQPF
jgi:hypothetical protein